MLSNITWSQYLGAAAIAVAVYYGVVIMTQYRNELKDLIQGKLRKKRTSDEPDEVRDYSSMDELEAVAKDLRYAILERAGRDTSKEELLEQFSQRLANYSGLRKPANRVAINNFLQIHAKEICGVALSEDELNDRWEALLR